MAITIGWEPPQPKKGKITIGWEPPQPSSGFSIRKAGASNELSNYQEEQNREMQKYADPLEYIRASVREGIEEYQREQEEDRGFVGNVLERTAKALPTLVATRGATLPAIAADIAGSAGAEIASYLGLGSIGELFVGLASQGGFRKLFNTLTKAPVDPNTLDNLAETAKKQFYKQEQELGSKIKIDASPYKNKLQELAGKEAGEITKGDRFRSVSKGLGQKTLEQKGKSIKGILQKDTKIDSGDANEIIGKINEYLSDFTGKELSLADLSKRRKELNYLIRKNSGPVKDYYESIRKPIVDLIKKSEPKYPEWYKALSAADAIHGAQSFGESFTDALEAFPTLRKAIKSPLLYSAAVAFPTLALKGPGAALQYGLGVGGAALAIPKAAQITSFIMHGPETQRLLAKATENVIKGNYKAATQEYLKLNRLAEKFEKDNPQQESTEGFTIRRAR